MNHSSNSDANANSTLANMSLEQQRELLGKLLRAKAENASQFPMSAGQQGLWHAFRRDPHSTAFNVFLPTRIRARIHLSALRQAVELIATRHPLLRATFSDAGGELTQRINADQLPEFTVTHLDGASDEQVREHALKEVLRPFDLETGPLLRFSVVRIAEDDWLLIAMTHHITVDFWSLMIILNEFREAYPKLVSGQELNMAPPNSNYAQFIVEQSQLLASPRGEQLGGYWKARLQHGSPVVDLPTDRLRPAKFTGRAGVVSVHIPDSWIPRISNFASENRATTFAVVQSALQVLISRYADQKQFFIGSPFSGRMHQKYERTVGFFVNMLPLAADLEGDPTFGQLVSRTASCLLEALEHEAYPISEIVHNSAISRDPSRSPLFQISCTFEKSQVKAESGRAGTLFPGDHRVLHIGGLPHESFYIPHPTCHYDLEFVFEQTESSLLGIICFCRDLFDAASVEQLAKNFVSLLDSLLTNGHLPISRTAWSTQSLGMAPSAKVFLPIRPTVTQMIDEAAVASRTAVALRMDQVHWTYASLMESSQALAQSLTERGVGPGSIVPIFMRRGPNAWVAMLGVHRAGAAFVPLDSDQPAIELKAVAEDTRAPLIITDQSSPAVMDCVIPHLMLPEDWSTLNHAALSGFAGGPCKNGFNAASPGQATPELAYVVYTSGSTGKPKGVLVDHPAVCNTLAWRKRDVPLERTDRVLMLLSHQFDAGLGIAWTTLTQGASLVWANEEARADPAQLIEQIIREEITVLPAVPSLLRILIAHPRFSECKSLRYIWTGGEAMPADLPQHIRDLSDAAFWNFYGPTEAAIEATAANLSRHDSRYPVPIGKPISNTEVLILDEFHRPVPPTVPGEIAIAGAGLARGYLNQPELTAEKFIAHPHDPTGPRRVYLTGDRGRQNPAGTVEFLGRNDHQIKLRGYRIELGEIESVLQAHHLVERAAVKLIAENTPGAQLVAFVSLDAQVATSERLDASAAIRAAIRRFAARRLPAYKLPSAIRIVDPMPMTTSGKVDRKRLPQVSPADLHQHVVIQPATPLEAYLAKAWCDALSLEQVSVDTNFFDAGGSSLQAAVLTSRLSSDLGIPIPTALLFDLADISQLARRLVELHPVAMMRRFGNDCVDLQIKQSTANLGQTGNNPADLHPLIAPLKPSGSKPPIFMVHPPGGIIVCYRELAQQLGSEQPLYGIRARGLHGQEPLPETLETMAAEYVLAVKSIQPHGPYVLGGWSLGGLVAYEMAQQLSALGEHVARLILLDTTIPEGATDLVPASERVNVGLEYGIELTLTELGDLAPEDQLPFLWEHASKMGILNEETPLEVIAKTLEDLQELFHHHVDLSTRYRMNSLSVPIVLFRPMDTPCEVQVSEDRGWGHLAADVQVHYVAGHHHSMVQMPHVMELARKIDALASSK